MYSRPSSQFLGLMIYHFIDVEVSLFLLVSCDLHHPVLND